MIVDIEGGLRTDDGASGIHIQAVLHDARLVLGAHDAVPFSFTLYLCEAGASQHLGTALQQSGHMTHTCFALQPHARLYAAVGNCGILCSAGNAAHVPVACKGTVHHQHIFHAAAADVSEQANIVAAFLWGMHATDGIAIAVEASPERMLRCSDGSPFVAVQVEVSLQRNCLVLEVIPLTHHECELSQVTLIVDVVAVSRVVVVTPALALVVFVAPAAALGHRQSRRQNNRHRHNA